MGLFLQNDLYPIAEGSVLNISRSSNGTIYLSSVDEDLKTDPMIGSFFCPLKVFRSDDVDGEFLVVL